MIVTQGNLQPMGRRYLTFDAVPNYYMQPYFTAAFPNARLFRGTTSPTDPGLALTARYSVAYGDGQYALEVFTSTTGYLDGQYSLALSHILALSETLNLEDDSTQTRVSNFTFSAGLSLEDALTASKEVQLSLLDSMSLTDQQAATFVFNISLPENLNLGDIFYAPGGGYSVYVMNTNNTAVSLYRNWDFQSMAKIGDSYFGASPEGLFRLEGDNDNGTDINAAVVTQSIDFRTQQMKSMGFALLGISQSGNIYVSVVHENNPVYTYRLVTSDTAMRNARAIIGKGMALRYWQFEIVNENGADFELESITYYPVVLTRRITER